MAQFEVLHATRPLESVGWVEGVASEGDKVLGADALDFHDGKLAELGIILLSTDEQAAHYRQESTLGHTATQQTVDLVRGRMPRSFAFPVRPSVRRSRLSIVGVGPKEEGKRILVARVGCIGQLEDERNALTSSINQALRRNLGWRSVEGAVGITLATIKTDGYISNKDLNKIGMNSLPERVYAGRGCLSRTTIEPY